jgi:hypothetical protein
MREALRRALTVVGLCAGAVLPSFGAELSGNVNGPMEQSQIETILQAVQLETYAGQILQLAIDEKANLTANQKFAIIEALEESADILEGAKAVIDTEPNPVNDEMRTLASGKVNSAMGFDRAIIKSINATQPKGLKSALSFALEAKTEAMYALQGVRIKKKDAAPLAANPAPPTSVFDPDPSSMRKFLTGSIADIVAGRFDAQNAAAKGKKERVPKYKGVHDAAHDGFKPTPNYYFSFTGKATTPGYIYKSVGRPLMGPFDVKFQVGAFDLDATEDTGSACVELDLQGSDPLQFFAVCGRRIDGGVQVFSQSHQGQHGNLFLPGSRIAQVRIVYTGTTFTCYAADGRNAPDGVLAQFATFNFTQGSTPLVAGIGASGLLKGAEIGLDEIQFIPK